MESTAKKKMKRLTALKGVLDGLRSSVTTPPKAEVEIEETLRPDHLKVCKTVRHGFPFQPTAVAFDPVQHILAIGTKTGSLRIIGRPGVDCHCVHDTDVAVIQILFLVNEGALVTVCSDDSLHLWNFRQKRPEIVHTLKFQRERITYCHLPFQSKWLYIGTERGNVHIVNIESFVLSGYVINWNKAIELSRKTHPGPVVHLSDNPLDPTKLLIGFESGAIVLWDLRNKAAESRSSSPEALRSIAWHHEGRQFMCSHSDGSLTTWSYKTPAKPINVMMPHAKVGKDGKPEPCKPITKVDWKSVRNGEPLIIFSGGMSYDRAGRTPSITVMNGKTTTVLEMEHNVVDFVVLCETPWSNDFQDPYAIVVLLQNDLVVVDLTTPGYPCFENPYPMDIHESPVTACQYYADCPPDLVPAFYSVGSKQKKTGFTDKTWPVNGGEWGTTTCSYPEIIITGHADGSVKFWDASAVTLQVLYKFKTAKIFEKPKKSGESQQGQQPDDDPFAITMIELCPESRVLCVTGLTHVIHFRFSKHENTVDLPVLEVSIMYEIADELDSPEFEYPCPQRSMGLQAQHSGSMGSYSSNASDNGKEAVTSVRVKSGQRKWSPGYQPDLVCLLTHIDGEPPSGICSMAFNTHYGLLAFGNECGLAIIDCLQKTCLLNLGTPDLYGSMDPYQRAPRSPHSRKQQLGLEQPSVSSEENKSPTTEQPPSATSPASASPSSSSSSSNPIAPPRAKRKSSVTQQGLTPITEVKSSPSTSQPSTPDPEDSKTPAEAKTSQDQARSMAHSRSEPTSPMDSDQAVLRPVKSSSTGSLHLVGREGSLGREALQADPSEPADVDKSKPEPSPKAKTSPKSKPKRPPPPKKLVEKTKSDSSTDPDVADTDEVDRCKRATSDPDLSKSASLAQALRPDPLVLSGDRPLAPSHAQSAGEEGSEHKTSLMEKMRRKSKPKSHRKPSSGDGKTEGETGEGVEVSEGKGGEETRESNNNVVSSPTSTQAPGSGKVKDHQEGVEGHHGKSFLRKMSVKLFGSGRPREEEEKEKPRNPRDVKVDIIDVTDETAKKPVIRRMSLVDISQGKHIDKNDGNSFSRSRSSSMSSLENVSKEAIQCLVFADSYTKKTDNCTCPCLWVGTSLGSVIVVMLNLPTNSERNEKPVFVSPSGTIFRLRGAILTMSFLDCNGMLIPFQTEQWKDASRDNKEDRRLKQQMSTTTKPRISPTSSTEICDRQFAIICSEKQARVMSLPSQTCAYKVRITETSFVVRAQVVSIRDTVCLMCYVANGHIMGFSLPSLKMLLETSFLPLTDFRIVRTFCFSNNGHAMYLCSPSEVQKLTYSSEICDNLNEMLGDLFMPCDTPEAPKQGFFKNLFSGGVSAFNREELFGEASGKASKGLAKHIPGTGGMSQLQSQSGAIGSEVARARQLFVERGERLGELDDKSAQMMTQAENFAQAAHQIMLKYKDKKWYQF